MVSRINPLVMATGSPAILESRTRLALYDGGQGPAIDLSQAAPPYPAESLRELPPRLRVRHA